MSKIIQLGLSNNQALHLWGILAGYSYDTSNTLRQRRVFKQDGTPKKSRKHYSDLEQELLDNIALSKLLIEELEKYVEFPKDLE